MQICLLEDNHHPLPVANTLFTILNGGKYFAKLDLSEACLQVEVDPEGRQLRTINIHRGLFQYTRLPFGIKTAPAIFQQIMNNMISGLSGSAAYLDDIIVVGGPEEELQQRLEELLKRIEDYGFHLSIEKCQLFLKTIKYLGFIFDSSGRRPDPEETRAIAKMPAPTNVGMLPSFLGLISYYNSFLPPLIHLLHKDVV